MDTFFISSLTIEKVRHLENITIPLSEEKPKHLIFTGKNGSGKTSVLEALSYYLHAAADENQLTQDKKDLDFWKEKLTELQKQGIKNHETIEAEKFAKVFQQKINQSQSGLDLKFNESIDRLSYYFEKGQFILAYYKAERVFQAEVPKHVEKIELKDTYAITETPRQLFVKYLLDLKVTEALAHNNGKTEKAEGIRQWFEHLQDLLRRIFEDNSLELMFEEDTFSFWIQEAGREKFDFNTLSSGFAAILDIVLDIIMRMEKMTNRSFDFCLPGIVLIDEMETHLHLDLQKKVLDLLTTVFPNIQWIISTHSPFILNSLENVVIYDLEQRMLVEDGLSNIPYSGIVEGYFHSSELSASLKERFERYKELVCRQQFPQLLPYIL